MEKKSEEKEKLFEEQSTLPAKPTPAIVSEMAIKSGTPIEKSNVVNPATPQYDYKGGLQQTIVEQISAQKVGSLTLSEEQKKILFSDFEDDEVLIRPDGLIYLSWTWYADRLSRAFGLGWQLVPAESPQVKQINGKPCVYWGFYFFVNGVYMGFAYGEHIDQRKETLSFGEATESAKSNALMRVCKGIGMSLKLWNKDYAQKWVATYAKKGVDGFWTKLTAEELQAKKTNFIKAAHALKCPPALKKEVLKKFGYEHTNEVKLMDMNAVYLSLRAIANREQEKEKENESGN